MTLALVPSTDDIMTGFRSFIKTCITLPENNLFQGLGNRVPMPREPFIVFTPILTQRYSTNVSQWIDPLIRYTIAQRFDIQVDLYGPQSEEWARILVVMFRSPEGARVGIQYSDDPRQMALTNEEQEYELRYSLTASLQVNSTLDVPAEFMDQIDLSFHQPADYFPPV